MQSFSGVQCKENTSCLNEPFIHLKIHSMQQSVVLLLFDESMSKQSEDLVTIYKKFPSHVESCMTMPMEDDGCSKVNYSQHHHKCQAHKCRFYKTDTYRCHKILKLSRNMSFDSYCCQCGKCSFYCVVNHTCPNGYDAVSSSRVFACVYPPIAAINGVIPKDHGPGALLLPINLVGGSVGEFRHYAIASSVNLGVKFTLVTQAVNKLSISTPEEPSLTCELDLSLAFDKTLSSIDQIVHTVLCTPSGGSTQLHSLEINIELNSPVEGVCIPTISSPFYNSEHLSVIQQCVREISHTSPYLLSKHLSIDQQSAAVATVVKLNVFLTLSTYMDVSYQRTGTLF